MKSIRNNLVDFFALAKKSPSRKDGVLIENN